MINYKLIFIPVLAFFISFCAFSEHECELDNNVKNIQLSQDIEEHKAPKALFSMTSCKSDSEWG